MIFYFCVSSCSYEQLHYFVSVEPHCVMQGCVPFLRVERTVSVTEMKYRDDEKHMNTHCLPCPWSWSWHRRPADTPQCWCCLFLWPHAEEYYTTAKQTLKYTVSMLFAHKSTHKHTKGQVCKYQYKTYNMLTGTQVWVQVQVKAQKKKKNTFTLSLTFKSAPWVFRTLTTSRLPPLQAQCMALEPSWNTVGGPPCY